MKMLPVLASLLLFGCAISAQDPESARDPDHGPPPEPSAAPFMAGELIVKFEASTPAAEVLGGTARGNPAQDPRLTAYVAELGEALSLPLVVSQVTSGAEILLVVDLPALAEAALVKTREREGVAAARAVPTPAGGALQPSATWSVRFAPGSGGGLATAAAAAAGESTSERLDALVGELSRELALPLLYRAAGSELELSIDLPALTQTLASRLREMPEVEYVELNQLYEPML